MDYSIDNSILQIVSYSLKKGYVVVFKFEDRDVAFLGVNCLVCVLIRCAETMRNCSWTYNIHKRRVFWTFKTSKYSSFYWILYLKIGMALLMRWRIITPVKVLLRWWLFRYPAMELGKYGLLTNDIVELMFLFQYLRDSWFTSKNSNATTYCWNRHFRNSIVSLANLVRHHEQFTWNGNRTYECQQVWYVRNSIKLLLMTCWMKINILESKYNYSVM